MTIKVMQQSKHHQEFVHAVAYAALTLNGFDDQEGNRTDCENGFPSFKTKISCLQLSIHFKNYILRDL